MPVICIGPVCIPWTCIPAIVFFAWKFIKPLLPEAAAAKCEEWGRKLRDVCAPYLEKIPGFGKKKKTAAPGSDAASNGDSVARAPGTVIDVNSLGQLEKLLERSKAEGFGVVLDFTAGFCKPCQALKPRFHELAAAYPQHCFAMVDAEQADDVMEEYGVMSLPTFVAIVGGERKNPCNGKVTQEKMAAFIEEHLGPVPTSGAKKSL
mmetsp:Transcript_40547/g.103049  ORF Transcript_40547/g.103049 Transcript_40547/m.103049 type:complete len:206 (+) Transcript_40547:74-691(+)